MQDEIDRYLRQPVEQPSTLADAQRAVVSSSTASIGSGWKPRDNRVQGDSGRRQLWPSFTFDWRRCCGSARPFATQRRVQLADAERADAELKARLTGLAVQQRQLQNECRTAAGPGEVDLPRLVEAHQYAGALRAEQAELQQQRQTLAVEIDRCRQALVEADRDVQTIEKLRENQRQAHGKKNATRGQAAR